MASSWNEEEYSSEWSGDDPIIHPNLDLLNTNDQIIILLQKIDTLKSDNPKAMLYYELLTNVLNRTSKALDDNQKKWSERKVEDLLLNLNDEELKKIVSFIFVRDKNHIPASVNALMFKNPTI